MSQGPLAAVLRRIHQVIGRRDGDEDGRLLARFAADRDEASFAALVRRHGPMVLAAGRRVLADANDAEDVFQATFLLLARKAGALRAEHSLGAWLHRTATRLALALREQVARRRKHERTAVARTPVDPAVEVAWRDVAPLLDAELLRLPDKYRLPVVLCCLEEKTHDEAARELGWPRGSVAGRLSRARELLRARLTRRGVTLTVATLSVLLAEKTARAAVPAVLVRGTVQVASAFPVGSAAAVSGKGAVLAEGALKGALATPVKVGIALVLAVGLATVAVALVGRQPPPRPAPQASAPPPAAHPAPKEPEPAHTDLFGDALPDGAETRLGTVRLRHASFVLSTVFAADGKTLYAADVGEGMRLWDVETGRPLGRIALGTYAYKAAMTPDRTRLVANSGMAGPVGTFVLWDVKADKEIRRFGKFNPNGIDALAISPDGKTLASANGNAGGKAHDITLWDADSGRELRRLEGHPEQIETLRFTPDGKELISAGLDHGVRVWSVETGRKRLEIAHMSYWAKVSPDGKTLVTGSEDHAVHLIDLADGKERCRITGRHGGGLAYTPDGRSLVAADSGGDFIFWDAETGKETRRFPGSEGSPQSLSFSPDGRTLATGGLDHSIRLFDVKTGKERDAYNGHRGAVVVAYSPDGKTAATAAGDGTVRLWDPRTGEQRRLLLDHKEDVLCMAYSPDGKLLATGGGLPAGEMKDTAIRLWDVETGKVARRLEGHEGPVWTLAFSPDGRFLASGGEEYFAAHLNPLRLWDVRTGKELRRFEPSNGTLSVAFSPDGATVAAGGRGKSLRLWNTADGKMLHESIARNLIDGTFRCVAFAPDGKTVFAGVGPVFGPPMNMDGDALRVFDHSTFAPLHQWPQFRGAAVALTFSRDGKTLAVGCQDNLIVMFETLTGREVRRFAGHAGTVRGVAFAPDSETLLSGSEDGTALIWDVTGHREDGKLPPVRLTPEQLVARWDDLADLDPAVARPALWELVSGAETSVPFLAMRVKPAEAPAPAEFAHVLADLNDDNFEVRERASAVLDRFGESVAPAVRKALAADPPAEVRRRLELALARCGGDKVSGPRARLLRAVEVLEHAASPEARALLKRLAGGEPAERLTREAKAALARLSR